MAIQKSLFSLFSNTPLKSDFSDIKDDNYLILQTPPEWFPLRDRKFWGCAHYSLKAVIEWKNEKSRPIKAYSVDWRSRTTYLMTPRWITKVLKKYKLKYKIIKANKLSENEKLEILKNNLKPSKINEILYSCGLYDKIFESKTKSDNFTTNYLILPNKESE